MRRAVKLCRCAVSQAFADSGVQGCERRFATGFSRIAEPEKGKTRFSGYTAGGFVINNVQVPGSVIAQSDMYLMWRPRTMAEVTPESLVFLELITPTPEVLVLGCGATAQPLPAPVAAYLASRGMKVEVLDSRNATGYFNILNEEGRVVVGALLAADPSLPLLEDLPEKKDPIYDRAWLKN
ncbi:NADH dehydrogenase 1 alpha subcomplex assembly factor 3 [Haematococcus lacustris]